MVVYDFSMNDYYNHNYSKFRGKRILLFFLIFIAVVSFVAMLYCISMNINLELITLLFGVVLVSLVLFSALANITYMDIDYFEFRNTFYVMYQNRLFLVTTYPKDKFGAYEEIGSFRMFLFLMFGKDVLDDCFDDHTSEFGPTKKDVLDNFEHFIYHNDFYTVNVEELGLVLSYENMSDSVKINSSKGTYYIKKYYTNLNNISNYLVYNSGYINR